MANDYTWRLEDCQNCGGQNVTMKKELVTKYIMSEDGQSQVAHVCDACGKQIDAHNAPLIARHEEELQKRQAAKRAGLKLAEAVESDEARECSDVADTGNVDSVSELGRAVATLAESVKTLQEQQGNILQLLMKEANVKPPRAPRRKR